MSVKNIEEIVIPGFGDLSLYSFSYTPGLSTSPGYVETKFINKTGIYPDINVGSHSFSAIYAKKSDGSQYTLGQFTIISSETVEDNQLKTLSIRFVDKSCELDRYIVAVRGQVGYDSTAYNELPNAAEKATISGLSGGGRVIWLGASDTACVEAALGASSGTDPCDPCSERFTDPILRQLSCNQYYLNNKRIYKYTALDLVNSGGNMGISFDTSGTSILSSNIKFDYSGNFRQVLNNVCNDLGYSFYYNSSSNSIKFISLQSGINVNIKNLESSENKHKILSKTIRKSRENSRDVWGVAGFSKESETKRYSCGKDTCRRLILNPFKVEDILPDPFHCDSFNELKFYSTLTAKAGKDFRDLFCFINKYEIKNANSAESKEGQKLSTLNGMTISKVFHKDSSNPKAAAIYKLLIRILSGKDISKIAQYDSEGVYFFLAKVDDVYEKKCNNLELGLSNDFLGKYWMRYYKQHWKSLSYNTFSPDGNVSYYDYKSPINLPFAGLVYDTYGTLKGSPLLDKLGGIVSGSSPNGLIARDTFFFMERPAQTFPGGLTESQVNACGELVSKYGFKEFSLSFDMGKDLSSLVSNYSPATHKLFVVTNKATGVNSSGGTSSSTNDAESANVNINVNACNKYSSYGLGGANCIVANARLGGVTVSFKLPPETSYNILLEKTGAEDGTYIVPKSEVFNYSSPPSIGGSALSSELNFFNATSNDLQLLAVNNGDTYCKMDTGKIQSLVSTFSGMGNYSIGISDEREYEIEGFPNDEYSPFDGLKGFSLSIGASGLRTQLSFSNTFALKLSPDSFLKKLNYARIAQIQNPTPIGTYNGSTSTSLPTS